MELAVGILGAVPFGASAASTISGDWEYMVSFDNALIRKHLGSASSLAIPDAIDGYSVVSFGNCFTGSTSLISITIPNSVTRIDSWAFHNCTSLTSIIIPDSVTTIGDLTFYNCTSLESITIPDSVTSIGRFTLCQCTSLTRADLGNSITDISQDMFSDLLITYKCKYSR